MNFLAEVLDHGLESRILKILLFVRPCIILVAALDVASRDLTEDLFKCQKEGSFEFFPGLLHALPGRTGHDMDPETLASAYRGEDGL